MEGRGAGGTNSGTSTGAVRVRLVGPCGPSLAGQRPEGEETAANCRANGFGTGEARQQGHLVVFRLLPQDCQTRGFQARVIRKLSELIDLRSISESEESGWGMSYYGR